MADTDDMNLIRVGVLGVSVDQSTTWTSTGPAANRNTLDSSERIVNRAINVLYDQAGDVLNATNAVGTRFTHVVGNEAGPDQTAFTQIGTNLIQAVAALKAGGTGGGAGLHVGPNAPTDTAAYPFWFDFLNLYVYDGETWVIAVNVGSGTPGGPGGPSYDSVNPSVNAGPSPVTQANSTPLGAQTSLVTGPTGGGGVRWDSPTVGDHRFVHNATASALTFFPPTGGQINSLAANAGFFIQPNVTGFFKAVTTSRLISVP